MTDFSPPPWLLVSCDASSSPVLSPIHIARQINKDFTKRRQAAMLDSNCRTLRVVIHGNDPIKDATAMRWKAVPNFDKLFAGAEPPAIRLGGDDAAGLQFTEYCNLDITLQKCHRAAAHRMFLLCTPIEARRGVLFRGLLHQSCGSIEKGADGVILFCNSSLPDHEEWLATAVNDCEEAASHVLVVYFGDQPISDTTNALFSHYDPAARSSRKQPSLTTVAAARVLPTVAELLAMEEDAREAVLRLTSVKPLGTLRFVATREVVDEGFLEISKAFVQFAEDIHDSLERSDEELFALFAEFHAIQKRNAARIPPVVLPPPHVVADCEWSDSHDADASRHLEILLCGGCQTGKTTFVTSVVDGFVVRRYVPTLELEVAHACVKLSHAVDGAVNLTMFDGAEHPVSQLVTERRSVVRQLTNMHASAALCFLDVTDPHGVEVWKRCITALPNGAAPPHLGLIAVKNDVVGSSLFSTDDLTDLAGEHGCFFAYLDPRSTSSSRQLLARFVSHIYAAATRVRENLDRQRLIFSTASLSEFPHSSLDIDHLFHRFDTRGDGYITLEEAISVLRKYHAELLFEPVEASVRYVETRYGPLTRSVANPKQKLVSKDQFGLMICRLNRQ